MPETLPVPTRLWFAFVCFFRVIFDGRFAKRAFEARAPETALPPGASEDRALPAAAEENAPAVERDLDPALQLLALLQRDGRLIDFLQQDIASFSDGDVGAAARVVHEGCRKALASQAEIRRIRTEAEGARLTLPAGFEPAAVKLTGNVSGAGPSHGVLRHGGWRVESLRLPERVGDHDARVLHPAEVEL